ncbi:hypothetical protein R1flu_001964 [Riccia fluitans]|uniref:Uncharacterized protein n=1 Tax=Riccia fluitans TaxID=41844 RepID=A0ABD1Y5T6_9MARC
MRRPAAHAQLSPGSRSSRSIYRCLPPHARAVQATRTEHPLIHSSEQGRRERRRNDSKEQEVNSDEKFVIDFNGRKGVEVGLVGELKRWILSAGVVEDKE